VTGRLDLPFEGYFSAVLWVSTRLGNGGMEVGWVAAVYRWATGRKLMIRHLNFKEICIAGYHLGQLVQLENWLSRRDHNLGAVLEDPLLCSS
jgi:hypothetical protein